MRSVFSATGVALSALLSLVMVGQASAAGQSITNYTVVDSARVTRTQWSFTYTADLVNTGAAASSVTATLTTSVPNIVVVAGQNVLNFGPVAQNGTVHAKNTFSILVDRTVAFDINDLHWAFNVTGVAPPVANAGPDQTVPVGTVVTLNGSASTNPSGLGTLTYSWAFLSKPGASAASITNPTNVMPTFLVDAAGSFTIQLTVSNGLSTSS